MTRRAGVRQHLPHAPRIRHTNKLGESRVQRGDPDMHAPLGKIRHQLQEWRCHAAAHRLGLQLRDIAPLAAPICIGSRSPDDCDGANAISLGSSDAHKNVEIGRKLAPGPEYNVPQVTPPQHSPRSQQCSHLIAQHSSRRRREQHPLDVFPTLHVPTGPRRRCASSWRCLSSGLLLIPEGPRGLRGRPGCFQRLEPRQFSELRWHNHVAVRANAAEPARQLQLSVRFIF